MKKLLDNGNTVTVELDTDYGYLLEDLQHDEVKFATKKSRYFNLPGIDPEDLDLEDSSIVYLPVYGYAHGGEAISTRPFSCRFDSGLIGYVYANKKDFTEEALEAFVKYVNQLMQGAVYGFVVTDSAGEVVDSCWGFVGSEEDCLKEAMQYQDVQP